MGNIGKIYQNGGNWTSEFWVPTEVNYLYKMKLAVYSININTQNHKALF